MGDPGTRVCVFCVSLGPWSEALGQRVAPCSRAAVALSAPSGPPCAALAGRGPRNWRVLLGPLLFLYKVQLAFLGNVLVLFIFPGRSRAPRAPPQRAPGQSSCARHRSRGPALPLDGSSRGWTAEFIAPGSGSVVGPTRYAQNVRRPAEI